MIIGKELYGNCCRTYQLKQKIEDIKNRHDDSEDADCVQTFQRSHKDWDPWIIGEYEWTRNQKRLQVFFKWKADPDAITVETHPNFVHRKMG
uniref:Uncharacterized protein n=1 Tax=Panagrolaimus davidi TaxID=227884 RepID=A0A914QAN7_9BILA